MIMLLKMFKTLVNFHICLNRDCCTFHSAVSNSFHWITRLTPKSNNMQKGKAITFHLWCSSFLTSVAPKKLQCSGSQSSKKSYIQLTFSVLIFTQRYSPIALVGRTCCTKATFCTDMSLTSLPFARLLNLLILVMWVNNISGVFKLQ